MSDKIVVIGSNSFSGASFIAYALKQNCQVIGISRSEEATAPYLPYKWEAESLQQNYNFVQADLNHDTDKIIKAVEDLQADYVINFAAQSMVAQSWDNPDHWYQTNVVANVKLHDQLRKLPFLKKYVHISTPEVYGSCEGLVDENFAFNPSTPYATSRAACDMHLKNFFSNYDFPVVFTRAANVYGPGQQLYRIIPRTILYIKLGKTLQLHGGGHSLRSFIHIDDVSAGTLAVAKKSNPPETFHFSTSQHISIRDLVAKICDCMKEDFNDFVEIVGDRAGKDAAYLLDTKKAETELNWKAQVDLDNGISQCITWIEKYLDTIKNDPLSYIHKA